MARVRSISTWCGVCKRDGRATIELSGRLARDFPSGLRRRRRSLTRWSDGQVLPRA